jgi:hypothetical protein
MTDEIAFPSTGDAAEDQKIADNFHLHSARMAENICPNGCGQMNWIDPHNRTCPSCGFAGFSTRAYDMKAGNA